MLSEWLQRYKKYLKCYLLSLFSRNLIIPDNNIQRAPAMFVYRLQWLPDIEPALRFAGWYPSVVIYGLHDILYFYILFINVGQTFWRGVYVSTSVLLHCLFFIFHSYEAGIAKAISSFKWQIIIIFVGNKHITYWIIYSRYKKIQEKFGYELPVVYTYLFRSGTEIQGPKSRWR